MIWVVPSVYILICGTEKTSLCMVSCVEQSVTCLATEPCLTVDPGDASSIPA